MRSERWREQVVGFDELTFDRERQRVYLFDFESADADVERQALEYARRAAEQARDAAARKHAQQLETLRNEIFAFWTEEGFRRDIHPEEVEAWQFMVVRAARHGVMLPPNLYWDANFAVAVAVLLSAQRGRPAGYAFKKLLQVAHQVAENHTELLVPFLFALRAYDTESIVLNDDRSHKWKARKKKLDADIEFMPEKFHSSLPYAATLRFLFPEVAEAIRG